MNVIEISWSVNDERILNVGMEEYCVLLFMANINFGYDIYNWRRLLKSKINFIRNCFHWNRFST